MDKKAKSRQMMNIVDRLKRYGEFDVSGPCQHCLKQRQLCSSSPWVKPHQQWKRFPTGTSTCSAASLAEDIIPC